MLRTAFWVTWFFAYLFCCLPTYFKAKRLGKQGKKEEQQVMVQNMVKKWATKLLHNLSIKLTVEGAENLPPPDETVVFVSNHQSYVDIPVLLAGLDFPRPLLSKKEIGKIPLLRGWMNLLGCLYVDREDVRSSIGVLRECEELLASGSSLIICPEGTRSKSDEMGEFKPGAVRIASKAKVRIVPLAIDGTYKALEGNRYRLAKCSVRLVILPPVETASLSRAEIKELPQQLENSIRQAKDNRPPE